MELFTTVALFTVLIATLLLVLRPRPAAIKRGQAPTQATPATPTPAPAPTPKIVVPEKPIPTPIPTPAVVVVAAAEPIAAPTLEADAITEIEQPESDVEASDEVTAALEELAAPPPTPAAAVPVAAATDTSTAIAAATDTPTATTAAADTPAAAADIAPPTAAADTAPPTAAAAAAADTAAAAATKANTPVVAVVAVARQPRGPSPASGFNPRADLCAGTQKRCGCGLCRATPSPPPSPPPQRCLPAGRKGSPPPSRPRFARLRLCKWEHGKHATEGCWEHNQNRSCPAVHKDQPDLLLELRRSRPPSASPPSSPRRQPAHAQKSTSDSSSNDEWVRAPAPPPYSQVRTAGWTVVQTASPRAVRAVRAAKAARSPQLQPKIIPGHGKHQHLPATFASFSSCSSPSRSRKGMRSRGTQNKRRLTPLAA